MSEGGRVIAGRGLSLKGVLPIMRTAAVDPRIAAAASTPGTKM
jgi:hypothetical protein